MTLNSNSLLAKFYKWVYGKYSLPKDFCTYFWNSLFAILLLPVYWPSKFTPGHADQVLFTNIVVGMISYIVAASISVLGFTLLTELGAPHTWWMYLIGLPAGAITSVLIVGTVIGFCWVGNFITDARTGTPIAKIVSATYGTVRNKYCTKLEWKE